MTWEYAERYNSEKEWNPRLIACTNCADYSEPEEMTQIHWESIGEIEDYCKTCSTEYKGDNQNEQMDRG